ncbi:MAG: hypothetical protein AAB439_03675 [Patescibacteria group bacterium]
MSGEQIVNRERLYMVYAAAFFALGVVAVLSYELNTGPCITRCIKELGMKAKVTCFAICTANPDAY